MPIRGKMRELPEEADYAAIFGNRMSSWNLIKVMGCGVELGGKCNKAGHLQSR